MLVEVEPGELGRRVDGDDRLGMKAGVERVQDRDQPALYAGLHPEAVVAVDAPAELARLDLDQHLSSQRSNGLRAMVARIRALADSTLARA